MFSLHDGPMTPPVDDSPPHLDWLLRRGQIGVACRLPDCSKVVLRKVGRGRPGWFCSREHGVEFRRRREALLAEVKRVNDLLAQPGVTDRQRRRVTADLNYLLDVLDTYPDDARAHGSDRHDLDA